MTFKVFAPETKELKPRIVVFGVGGAGGNAVNNMIEAGLEGVEFVVANTDAQQLAFSKTDKRIQLGVQVTQGLGAGAHPEVGMSAAEESAHEIGEHLDGAHMVFITAGMGGGTGTGAGPIIAKCARERGILTVGVVTKPFHFEGRHRMRLADSGISELQRYVDTLIVIPNQNLFRIANERTTFSEAFGMADQVLHSGVRSITDLMVLPGLINLDFADVRTVMTEMGKAMMGTGEGTGEGRALMAAENAIQNPLLDEVTLKGAKAVLVNITGGLDMTLLEVDEAANAISNQVDPDANIIFGAAFDPSLNGQIRVSVVATGMDGAAISAIEQPPRRVEARSTAPAPQAWQEPAVIAQIQAAQAVVVEQAAVQLPEPVNGWVEVPHDDAAHVSPAPINPAPIIHAPARTFEPLRAQSYQRPPEAYQPVPEAQGDLPLDMDIPQAPVAAETRNVGRIIDPSVQEFEDEADTGLVIQPLYPEEHRRQKSGGIFGMFGRQRFDPPVQSRGAHGSAAPAQAAQPEVQEGEDLEIPSFLRRLAN